MILHKMQLTKQDHCSGTLSWCRVRHCQRLLESQWESNVWYFHGRGGAVPRNASYLRLKNWKRRWKNVKRNTGMKSVLAWASQQRGARKPPKIDTLRCRCTRSGLYSWVISSVQLFNRFITAVVISPFSTRTVMRGRFRSRIFLPPTP
jgi:hypothetical protein